MQSIFVPKPLTGHFITTYPSSGGGGVGVTPVTGVTRVMNEQNYISCMNKGVMSIELGEKPSRNCPLSVLSP
jgi:hypothetical protein